MENLKCNKADTECEKLVPTCEHIKPHKHQILCCGARCDRFVSIQQTPKGPILVGQRNGCKCEKVGA